MAMFTFSMTVSSNAYTDGMVCRLMMWRLQFNDQRCKRSRSVVKRIRTLCVHLLLFVEKIDGSRSFVFVNEISWIQTRIRKIHAKWWNGLNLVDNAHKKPKKFKKIWKMYPIALQNVSPFVYIHSLTIADCRRIHSHTVFFDCNSTVVRNCYLSLDVPHKIDLSNEYDGKKWTRTFQMISNMW